MPIGFGDNCSRPLHVHEGRIRKDGNVHPQVFQLVSIVSISGTLRQVFPEALPRVDTRHRTMSFATKRSSYRHSQLREKTDVLRVLHKLFHRNGVERSGNNPYLFPWNFYLEFSDYTFMEYSPSMLAAMSVCAARVSLGLIEPWPFELELVTSFSLDSIRHGVTKLLKWVQSATILLCIFILFFRLHFSVHQTDPFPS